MTKQELEQTVERLQQVNTERYQKSLLWNLKSNSNNKRSSSFKKTSKLRLKKKCIGNG